MDRGPAENQKRRKKSQSDSAHAAEEMDEEDLALFHVVTEDLRIKSTVGWQNAVKSLNAALAHIERDESQRFLDAAFFKIVSIMLDQHSSKIGAIEKSCVTQTLAVSIPLVIAQLKSGRYAQALPVLVMVFNKKRTFYKDIRTPAMMGNYWNRAGGVPEVRAQCIASFCELNGFQVLLETLEAMVNTMLSSEKEEKEDDTTHEQIDSEDVRILLQALLEHKTSVTNDVIERICTLIMTYFVGLPEAALKKESTDAVGAVVSIVRRFVDAGSISAMTINGLWLNLTLRYAGSSSLPLRLFGLEQITQIVNAARASRAYPSSYIVRNAGTEAVNGVYILKQDGGGATYVLKKEDTGQTFTLFCCTMKSGLKWWFISEADKMQPGSDQDIDYYQHQSQFEEVLPPTSNWIPISRGVPPAPELIAEPIRGDDDDEACDPSRFDHVFGAWVIDKKIVEAIFGDRIHREVVSRSAPLIKFLAETNKLREDAIGIIWGSSLQKDRPLMDEIHTLIVGVIPYLSHQLLMRLIAHIDEELKVRQRENKQVPDIVVFLERLAAAESAFFQDRPHEITDSMLRLLWHLQRLDVGVDESSQKHPHRLSRGLVDFFKAGLRSDHGESIRREFLDQCLSGIKRSCFLPESTNEESVVAAEASSSLELLKFLIDSYGVELSAVVESMNREHELVKLLFDELAAYVKRQKASGTTPGRYEMAIGHRLELIHYVHVRCPMLELTIAQIQELWSILSSTPSERECCLAFFNHTNTQNTLQETASSDSVAERENETISSAFTPEVRRFIFEELLCKGTDFACLGELGYSCFHSYFVEVNSEITGHRSGNSSRLFIHDILGVDALWNVAFEAPMDVATPASEELLRVYRGLCARGDEAITRDCVKDFLHRILTHLEVIKDSSANSLRQVQQSTVLLNGFVDALHGPAFSIQLSSSIPHGRRGRGAIFDIKVIAQRIPGAGSGAGGGSPQENSLRTLRVGIYSNQTLGQLKKSLEDLIGHPAQQMKILCAGAALTGEEKTMTDLRVSEASELRALLFNTVVQRPLSPDADEGMDMNADNSCSVGDMISRDENYFDVLFRVLDVVSSHPVVHKSLWELLYKLPTNVQLLERLTTMNSSFSVTSELCDDQDGDSSMEVDKPVENDWSSLLDETSQNKPIYILQIVDALLLPSDMTKLDFAQVYKKRFVSGGGFDAVLTYLLKADVRSSLFNEGAAVALRVLRGCLFQHGQGTDDDTSLTTTGNEAARINVKVKREDYMRLALKIADLVLAEYSQDDHLAEVGANESERILVDALKTVTSIINIEPDAAAAYMTSDSLGGELLGNILLCCQNDQVRENWLLSLQSVCQAASLGSEADTHQCVRVVYERVIASIERIEEVSVPCDQYFRLLRFLVQEEQHVDLCKDLATAVLRKLHTRFSPKFLAVNDRAGEVVSGFLEFLRDVLAQHTSLRESLGRDVVQVVFDQCLFTLPDKDHRRGPLCASSETRRPAFKLLATAISTHAPIIQELENRLLRLFTRSDGSPFVQHSRWSQENTTETRRTGEHVGLKNQGCSCYMNSFLQQIFMQPTLRHGLLSAQVAARSTPLEPTKAEAEAHPERLVGCRIALECMNGRVYEASVMDYHPASRCHQIRYDDGTEATFVLSEGRPGSENGRYAILQTELTGADATLEVLRQVQRTFCYLQDSEMRYFNPKALVEACKCLNLEFSVYQQNDASEFCDKLLDRLETGLKSTPQGTKCLDHAFGGKLISQKLPQGCGHRFEREEPFIRLELQIRGKESIEESLASFVEGELMDGDNKVECELCATKKAVVRRTCFGALPNVLILHLKRFDLDFTTFETVKLNNRCSFPMTLNMKPYTKEGLEEREAKVQASDEQSSDIEERMSDEQTVPGDSGDVEMNDSTEDMTPSEAAHGDVPDPACEYRLKGILVHSGVAQGGHYYSFIYDHVSEKWFKFDDEDVSPFDPANIEAECFGGVQKRAWHGASSSMEMEVFSNALMLFYEKIEPNDTEYAESLAQSAEIGTGSAYESEVWKANEIFLQNSYVLDTEFHEFLREMVHSKYLKDQVPITVSSPTADGSLPPTPSESVGSLAVRPEEAIQMTLARIGIEFVFSVLLHSREKHGIARWITVLAAKFVKYKSVCVYFFQALGTAPKSTEWLRSILFESPDSIARQSFVHLSSRALAAYDAHMKRVLSEDDEVVLRTFLNSLTTFLDETSVSQQTHLEECFMMIRNCADFSIALREGMRCTDMIARLVNCFLGERAPSELKDAFQSSHLPGSANRYASPDYQYLLEAIIAILGFPRRTAEPLVIESNTHYPHRITLSEKAEQALTQLFEEHQNESRGSMTTQELEKYLSVCMSCSTSTPAVQQKAHGIMSKYGKQSSPAPGIRSPAELELDGFLMYYTDAASAASKNVQQDLRAHGFGEDLKRCSDASSSNIQTGGLESLSELSRLALLNDAFFDSALEEDAETVADMLLRIVDGDQTSSCLLLRSLLQCLASTETGWKGQPVVDTCSLMLQSLLGRESDYQEEMIEMAMIHPEFGVLTTAENRERVRQRYANSNLVPLFVFRQIVVVIDLNHKVPRVASWLAAHRRLWEWMYEWLRLESLRPSLGGRLAVLYRDPSKLETLCRLGEALSIPYREEERAYIVEGAGFEPVNGVYKSTNQTHDNCTIYTCVKEDIEYTLFRCSMPSKARRWYISYSPNKSLLGTVSDEDYYFVHCHIDDDSPPDSGWRVWTKNEKALPPAPTVRLYSSTVASDNHTALQFSSDSVFSSEMDAAEGDVDADADTVEYDDSEDEIRVSNERFQAVHLDNQDDADRSQSPVTDDFM